MSQETINALKEQIIEWRIGPCAIVLPNEILIRKEYTDISVSLWGTKITTALYTYDKSRRQIVADKNIGQVDLTTPDSIETLHRLLMEAIA